MTPIGPTSPIHIIGKWQTFPCSGPGRSHPYRSVITGDCESWRGNKLFDPPEAAMASHPYYPLGADIVSYSPNQTSVLELLVSAGGGCAALLGLTFAVASCVRPSLRLADRIAILWFVLCMRCRPNLMRSKINERNSWHSALLLRRLLRDPS